MNIIKNIIMSLIAAFIVTAFYLPIIFGFPTGLIVLGLGWVLFMLGRGFHVKADVVNHAQLYGIGAFLMGSILVQHSYIKQITSILELVQQG